MRISDWSSDVCSSDLAWATEPGHRPWRHGRLPAAQLADFAIDRRSARRRQGLHADRARQDRRRPRPHLPREHAESRRLMVEAIRTTCAYCGVGCGIRATVTGERKVEIAGDPDHPANTAEE